MKKRKKSNRQLEDNNQSAKTRKRAKTPKAKERKKDTRATRSETNPS